MTVFIRHRLGSTKVTSHIPVMRDGWIFEGCTHEQVLKRHEFCYEMFTSWVA